MSTQPLYQPALNHLHNQVAATEIELGRLREEQQTLQRRLEAARTRRYEILCKSGKPITRPLELDRSGSRPQPPTLITLNQTIAGYEQALSNLKRHIADQMVKMASARRALEGSAGLWAAGDAATPGSVEAELSHSLSVNAIDGQAK